MAGGYDTVSEGLILVATIAGWNWLLDWAAFHSPTLAKFIEPPTILLIRSGRSLLRNLRSQRITLDDVRGQLREHGVESMRDVKRAYLESDGRLSVIARGGNGEARGERDR